MMSRGPHESKRPEKIGDVVVTALLRGAGKIALIVGVVIAAVVGRLVTEAFGWQSDGTNAWLGVIVGVGVFVLAGGLTFGVFALVRRRRRGTHDD